MHTPMHTKESLKALEDRLWREAEMSDGTSALVRAYEAGRMSMLAESSPGEDYGWTVLDPVKVDWAVSAAKQWLNTAECPDCTSGRHAQSDDGFCPCCSAVL